MERLDRIVGKLALPLVLVTLVAVPLAAFGYDRWLNSQVPRGARVFDIYFDGTRNWTQTRLAGYNTFSDPENLTELRVRRGDLVVLRLMATDVHHGFALPAFGVDPIELSPGHLHEVRFWADKVGEFPLFCTIVCGPAHDGMQATLVVTP
ncbi:MAG: hypothetical protein HYU54_04830 [Actinobacteria bacterium]|nr:hypothetical protein [Actinomycetota bacterium]